MQKVFPAIAALTSFVCPDALGSQATFRTVFAAAIARSRDRNATPEEVALGAERSAELNRQVTPPMLYRLSIQQNALTDAGRRWNVLSMKVPIERGSACI